MVITQKVTLLTFSIHDGIARNENELTKSQQFHAIRRLPTALEYFSYVLHFQGLMAGPLVFYKDYIEFIEGTNILKHNGNNVSSSATTTSAKMPSFNFIFFNFRQNSIKVVTKLLLNHHHQKRSLKKLLAAQFVLTFS